MGLGIILNSVCTSGPCLFFLFIIGIIFIFVFSDSFKKIPPNYKGIVLTSTTNKYIRTLNPGKKFVMPFSEKLVLISMKPEKINISNYKFITKDGQDIYIKLTIYYNIKDLVKYAKNKSNFGVVTNLVHNTAISTTEEKIKNINFDEYKAKNWQIIRDIKEEINSKIDKWGLEVVTTDSDINNKVEKIKPKKIIYDKKYDDHDEVFHDKEDFHDRGIFKKKEKFDKKEKFVHDKNKNFCYYCHADLPSVNFLGYAKCKFCGKRNRPGKRDPYDIY